MRSKNFTMLQILYNEDITEANWRWRELITAVIHRTVINVTFGLNYAMRWKIKASHCLGRNTSHRFTVSARQVQTSSLIYPKRIFNNLDTHPQSVFDRQSRDTLF